MARLDDWRLLWFQHDLPTPGAPPWTRARLAGVVSDHPKKRAGAKVITTRIQAVDGRTIVTCSGTRYELGEPARMLVQQLAIAGVTHDPDNPLDVLRAILPVGDSPTEG